MFENIDVSRMSWMWNWIIIGVTLIVGCYKYATRNFGIFRRLGIKGPKPMPVLGNLLGIQSIGLLKYDLEMKKIYGPIVGCFFGKIPTLVIHDLQILKQISVKDFNLFPNRLDLGFFGPPISKMVVFLKGEHWRHVRSILNPTFSSGKMSKLSTHLSQCCDTLCANLTDKANSGEVFDFEELCRAYSMDVIASVAFGIQIDSHNDPKNEFVINATKIFDFTLNGPMLLFMFSPTLYHFFAKCGFSIMSKSIPDFFLNVVDRVTKERRMELTGNRHIDLLHIILAALKENEESEIQSEKNCGTAKVNRVGLTNDEVIAQGFNIILMGFETPANTLALFGYCMALYPDIQERLYDEIIEQHGEESEPTYDSVKDMEYLKMCLSETLRMYPTAPRTDRVALRDVTINGLFIPKGMTIVFPIAAIHYDPDYWEEPEVFNPERFAPSVRGKIDPLTYVPFGIGPRTCIGMRLAILELKMAIVKMMRKFKFLACSETQVPLTFELMTLRAKNGIKIQVEKRK